MTNCPICNKEFKQLHGGHLKLHNTTCEEVKSKFPFISFRNEGTYRYQLETKEELILSDNIKCLQCDTLITSRDRKRKKFCNSSCAATYNNLRKQARYQKTCHQCSNVYYSKCVNSKFCTYACSVLNKTREKITVTCDQCTNTYLKSKRLASKSIKHFCSNDCKKTYYKINSKERGIYHGHNGKSALSSYRKLAFDNFPHECYHCKYNKYPNVLQVHHLDENRENNNLENLRIVCPTCHSELHKGFI